MDMEHLLFRPHTHMEEAIETGDYEKLNRDALSAYREHLRSKFEQPYVNKWRKE